MSSPAQQDSPPPTLTPVQAQVVHALSQGVTITAAAQAAGLHRATIHNWLKTLPAFETAVNEARADYVLTLRDDLKSMSCLALSTLRGLLETNDTPAAVRLRAALAVLHRPEFPVPGWRLPEATGSADQEKFMQNFALIEMDFKQFRYEQALNRAEHDNKSGAEIPPAE
jgi:Homeodomain-like domain